MSQDWNNPDFQADIAREAMQADHKIEELQAKVAKMQLENLSLRLALANIASIPMLLACQDPGRPKAIAERALKDLPPT